MDTINNQQQGNQQQGVPAPSNPAGNTEQQKTQYQNPDMVKGKSGRTTILLVVLLIIVIVIAAYLIFVNSMGNKSQSTPTATSLPSPTITPTSTPAEEFYVEDPETDIKALDDAASTL